MRALLLALSLVACTSAPPVRCPDGVPSAVAPPSGVTATLALDAHGVQIYQCRAVGWVNLAPDAQLLTRTTPSRLLVSHRAGPSWQSDKDGSVVFAAKSTAAPSADPDAIDQVLLQATTHAGPQGVLTPVTWVQRVATRGGLPAGACAAATGEVSISEYSATYVFYSPTPPGAAETRCGS